MNIDLRKVKEIANPLRTEHIKVNFSFWKAVSDINYHARLMNIGLRKVKEILRWIYLVNLSLLKDVSDINYRVWFLGV